MAGVNIATESELYRCRRIVREAITAVSLDLTDLVVLTEAATGPYALTASIAAMAGARHIYALARASQYGTINEAKRCTEAIAEAWGLSEKLSIIDRRDHPAISEADIVTNLGAVRPIDVHLINQLKSTAVVALMFETWEFRPEDVDLAECRRCDIAILGTNENLKELNILSYLGPLVIKLLFECGIEVYRSAIVVLGSDSFGRPIEGALNAAGASATRIDPTSGNDIERHRLLKILTDVDAIVVAEHRSKRPLFGEGGLVNAWEIAEINRGLRIVHVAGNVDHQGLVKAGLACWPDNFSAAGYMSASTAYVGPKPLIYLHSGGLRVGELLARGRLRGLRCRDAKREALKDNICQDFPTGFMT